MSKLFFIAILSLALTSLALGQETTTQPAHETADSVRQAMDELNEAARAYKAGNFVEAQRRSERSLRLNPTQKTAPFFIARSIHAQYRQGIDTPENTAKAREAISSYQRILEREPDNEEAFNAIAFLYGAIKEDKNQLEWVKRRALDSSVSLEKRAQAYIFLASKDWDCSFQVTEDKENQYELVGAKGKKTVRFKMPQNREDFERASLCTTRGLEQAEMAIKLNPDNEKAWGYKSALFYEARKLAEMEGKMKRARGFWRKGQKAHQRAEELKLKKPGEE